MIDGTKGLFCSQEQSRPVTSEQLHQRCVPGWLCLLQESWPAKYRSVREGSDEAMQAKNAVPIGGEEFVLLMQLRQRNTLAVYSRPRPLHYLATDNYRKRVLQKIALGHQSSTMDNACIFNSLQNS